MRRTCVRRCTGRLFDLTLPGEKPSSSEWMRREWRSGGKWDAKKELQVLRGEMPVKARGYMLCDLAESVWKGNVTWEDSAANVAFEVEGWEGVPEVGFIGMAGVGKSTLLQKLFAPNRSPVREAGQPGNHTQMNFFRVANCLRIIETPGYGYTAETLKVQHQWQNATLSLIKTRPMLKHLYLLVNPKPAGFTERDKSMVEFLTLHKVSFSIVIVRADRYLKGTYSEALREMDEGERHAMFAKQIDELKNAGGVQGATTPVIVTSAVEKRGIGQLMYDIAARCFADVPTKDLYIDNVIQHKVTVKQRGREEEEEEEEGELESLIMQTTWLPPANLPSGFFYAPVHEIARKRPKREATSIAMLTPEEEAKLNNEHPLKGDPLLARFFPTLAETYLRQNHADLNPMVKPKAEQYFGMPLPAELRMKYSTPEEKEKWRKLLKKP